MFAHAAKLTRAGANLDAKPFPKPALPQSFVSDSQAPRLPIWHFDHDASATPALVSNLTCVSRGMGNGRMTVATAVTLEQAAVKTMPSPDGKAQSVDIDLPLTPAFVIQKMYLKTSTLNADSHFLYPLPAEIDLS